MNSIKKYTVPDYMKTVINKADNCYLLMHRFLIWEDKNENVVNDESKNSKSNNKKNVNNLKPVFFIEDAWSKKIQESMKKAKLNNMLEKTVSSMTNGGVYEAKCFNMNQTWNMVVGLGTVSVSETSMTLHHIYGIPYIPGQTLKGIVRSYVISEFFNNDEDDAMRNDLFAQMFGRNEVIEKDGKIYNSKQGELIFFDAVPINNENINCNVDIMSNHHKKYYESDNLRDLNDSENPVPIRMLVINGAEFVFRIAIKKKNNIGSGEFKPYFEEELEGINTVLDSAVRYAKLALEFCGVGAKTAVGYGLFKEVQNIK